MLSIRKNAPRGRFFIAAVSGILYLLPGLLCAANDVCGMDGSTATLVIRYVIDGDTVKLVDGTNLRLVGLDTPELGREGKADEPGAIAARDYLVELLSENSGLPVVYDAERYDRHGRMLGHLFLSDGRNIQALLLAGGYGTLLVIPPNLKYIDCYRSREREAIVQRRGIWSNPRYRVMDVEELGPATRGYHRVSGRVSRIGQSSSSFWINLGENLALRIVRSDLKYFKGIDLLHLRDRTVLGRGWVYLRNGELRMRIRHPVDMQINWRQ